MKRYAKRNGMISGVFTRPFTQSGLRRSLLAATVIWLAGCAASDTKPPPAVNNSALYEGRSAVTFANLPVAETPAQGIELGDEALRLGEQDKALYFYLQAINLEPANSEAYFKIGSIHLQRGNHDKAALALEGALKADPNHIGAYQALGTIELKRNRYELARQHFTRATALDQQRVSALAVELKYDRFSPADAYSGLGVLADLRGEHALAQQYYNTALAIRPQHAPTLNNRGYSWYLANDWKAAEHNYRLALKYNAKYAQAWRNLGLLYARQARYVQALNAFEQVMETPNAYNDLGYICMLEGKYDKAEYFFNQALSLSPVFYEKAQQNLTQTLRMKEAEVSQR